MSEHVHDPRFDAISEMERALAAAFAEDAEPWPVSERAAADIAALSDLLLPGSVALFNVRTAREDARSEGRRRRN